jgi:hypothetical protein
MLISVVSLIECLPRRSSVLGDDAYPAATRSESGLYAAAKSSMPSGVSPCAVSSHTTFGNKNRVSFVSAPFSGGQPRAGAEFGPDAIFASWLNAAVPELV